MNQWRLRVLILCLPIVILIFGASPLVSADILQSQSTNYGVGEVFFGSGGQLGTPGNGCSTNYCARASLGDLGVGNSASTNYQLYGGHTTTDVPTLQFAIFGSTVDLGTLNVATTGEGSLTFSVLDYVSSGYSIILTGNPPQNLLQSGEYTMSPITSAASSSAGTEQFGINLMANNVATATPSTSFGAAVQQVPDSTFGFGTPSAGYNTANKFQFNAGDTIASSSKASGESLFTMSMIANIANSTPGGGYTGNMGLVVVATF